MMIYIFILVFLSACVMYYLYKRKYRRSPLEKEIKLRALYRIQDYEGQYSEDFKSRHGSLIFSASCQNEQLRAIVIRKVKVYHSKLSVKLNRSANISFLENKDQGLAISVRFQITSGPQVVDLTGCKVRLIGVLNLKDGDRFPFKMSIPMENVYQHQEERNVQ